MYILDNKWVIMQILQDCANITDATSSKPNSLQHKNYRFALRQKDCIFHNQYLQYLLTIEWDN